MQYSVKGNIFGIIAILLWATLATFGVLASKIPPFELTSLSFFVAFFIGILVWKKQNDGIIKHLKLPIKVWLVGVFGLFGYHFFYFLAIQNAPAIEANLINYLWPLFIVLFSSFLPNEKLKWFHIAGTFLGLVGVVFLVSKNGFLNFDIRYIDGYIYAFIAALTWSSYSVISRYFAKVPTSAVGGFCGVTAVLSMLCHFVFESTVIPNTSEFLVILALGLGPVGGAFFVWDYGVKKGDIMLLGSLSYAIPLLSTFLLIFVGLSQLTPNVLIAAILIVLGSILSSWENFKKLLSKRIKQ
ncbi:DMT family transporter [Sulfurospirillum sp. 1307]|jgi:drug/metabolite transporter (DMT)-like permease